VERLPLGPQDTREEEDEDAGHEAGRSGEELSGSLRVLEAERCRQAAERAGEREPERRRVPDARLRLGGQPVLARDDIGVLLVREGVVAA
jgi:hypothetical protein